MRSSWSVSWTGAEGPRRPAWHCQVLHSAHEGEAIVIDLVALEDCPADELGCPRHTPFSLHIGGGDAANRWWHRGVRTWAEAADEITIVCGDTADGTSWMCLTSDAGELLLQI